MASREDFRSNTPVSHLSYLLPEDLVALIYIYICNFQLPLSIAKLALNMPGFKLFLKVFLWQIGIVPFSP